MSHHDSWIAQLLKYWKYQCKIFFHISMFWLFFDKWSSYCDEHKLIVFRLNLKILFKSFIFYSNFWRVTKIPIAISFKKDSEWKRFEIWFWWCTRFFYISTTSVSTANLRIELKCFSKSVFNVLFDTVTIHVFRPATLKKVHFEHIRRMVNIRYKI